MFARGRALPEENAVPHRYLASGYPVVVDALDQQVERTLHEGVRVRRNAGEARRRARAEVDGVPPDDGDITRYFEPP